MRLYYPILITFLTFGLLAPAWATCWHCGSEQGPPGADGVDGIDGTNGLDGKDWLNGDNWSDDDLNEVFAATTAMAGIDFDSTTSKLQLGVAIGGYGGEEQAALGIGKVLDNKKFGDILISFKTTINESGRDDDRPWVASAVWKVKIE